MGKAGARYYLFIDPYPHSFTLGPAQIVAAIRWARGEGWSAETGPTKPLAFDEVTQRFVWLPADQRHLRELRPIPDNL